jgi:hypothetical protein
MEPLLVPEQSDPITYLVRTDLVNRISLQLAGGPSIRDPLCIQPVDSVSFLSDKAGPLNSLAQETTYLLETNKTA